jgi:CheY-like chemotaxis protein
MEDLTLLIAEDEDNNFELLKILFGKRIKKIHRACNGEEVISILKAHKPDLILMDLKMPVMDGYEATRLAKIIYPDLKIIALTAYTQPEEERHAMEAGCSAFISKPIRSQDLMEAIKRNLSN